MTTLNPQPPFVWPEPRVLEGTDTYEYQPPFDELGLTASSAFGIVSAITVRGIQVIETWLEKNLDLHISLIVTVYPACGTRQEDLSRLLDLVQGTSPRISIRIHALESITDRSTTSLCFRARGCDTIHLASGLSEDFSLDPRQDGHVNLVFQPDHLLFESFRSYFDWLWPHSRDIAAAGMTLIPALVMAQGTEEGAMLWQAYVNKSREALDSQSA